MFTFRLHFAFPPSSRIEVPSRTQILIPIELNQPDVLLRSMESNEWIATRDGFACVEDATAYGERLRDALIRCFAELGMGADFGDRQLSSAVYKAFLQSLGTPRRPVLQGGLGLQVYQTQPQPTFVENARAVGVIGQSPERLSQALSAAWSRGDRPSERERVAFDVYAASTRAEGPDIRLLLLVMSVEVLATAEERGLETSRVVDAMLRILDDAKDALGAHYRSMHSTIKQLRQESIGQACHRVVSSVSGIEFGGKSAERVFKSAYGLRSRLTHGTLPRPERDEVSEAAVRLDQLVRHLLSRGTSNLEGR